MKPVDSRKPVTDILAERLDQLRGTAVSFVHVSAGRVTAWEKTWCGRRESNPHEPFKPCGFSCRLRLSPPGCSVLLKPPLPVCGLDYPFTLSRTIRGLGAARLVSTPSRLVSRQAWLGIATLKMVSPTLSSSASPVSRRALKFFSSPLRLPFRHARVAALTTAVYDRAGLPEFTRWFHDAQSAAKPGISGGLCSPLLFLHFWGRTTLIAVASSRVLM
jgi:hypothetical protein